MSTDKGWVKVSRSIQEHWLWKDRPFTKGQAWIDLLMSVNHEDNKILFDGRLITVKRGQIVTSMLKLADKWGWSRWKVKSFLDDLCTDEMVHIKTTKHCTIITIVNYGKFQNRPTTDRQQNHNRFTTDRQQTDTNKNDIRMIKNDKEESPPAEEDDDGEWEDP